MWPMGQMWFFVRLCVATTSLYLSNYDGNYCRCCFSRRSLQLLLPNFSAHISLLQGFRKDGEQILTFPFVSSGVSKCVKRQSSLSIFTSVFQHIQMHEKMLNDSNFSQPNDSQFCLFLLQMALLYKKNFTNAHFDL